MSAGPTQEDALRSALMRVTGSLGLIIGGAKATGTGHKENYENAVRLLDETFESDPRDALIAEAVAALERIHNRTFIQSSAYAADCTQIAEATLTRLRARLSK